MDLQSRCWIIVRRRCHGVGWEALLTDCSAFPSRSAPPTHILYVSMAITTRRRVEERGEDGTGMQRRSREEEEHYRRWPRLDRMAAWRSRRSTTPSPLQPNPPSYYTISSSSIITWYLAFGSLKLVDSSKHNFATRRTGLRWRFSCWCLSAMPTRQLADASNPITPSFDLSASRSRIHIHRKLGRVTTIVTINPSMAVFNDSFIEFHNVGPPCAIESHCAFTMHFIIRPGVLYKSTYSSEYVVFIPAQHRNVRHCEISAFHDRRVR